MSTSEAEIRRKQLKPEISKENVLAVLSNCQNVQILRQLDSYDDVNYMISIDDTKYLFKVHNGVESDNFQAAASEIQLQMALASTLTQAGLATSGSTELLETMVHDLPTVSGKIHPLVCRLLTWVEGTPMSDVRPLAVETLANAGVYLGKMHLAWDGLDATVPAAARYHQWDGKNALDLREFVQYVQTEERRNMIESIIDTFEKEILPHKDSFQVGLNHGDYNDANIIVQDGRVVGVIDFGDSVATWRILDICVAMAYSMLSPYAQGGRCLSAAAALLRGYHSVYSVQHFEQVYTLIVCRLATSVTLGAYSYQQNPGNEYLLLHAEPAWTLLDKLWTNKAIFQPAAEALWKRACDACVVDSKTGLINCAGLCFADPTVSDPMAASRTQ